jgi:hypothetical protein
VQKSFNAKPESKDRIKLKNQMAKTYNNLLSGQKPIKMQDVTDVLEFYDYKLFALIVPNGYEIEYKIQKKKDLD